MILCWFLLYNNMNQLFSSVQLLSHVRLFATPWTAARQASLSTTNSQSLLKLMFIVSVMQSNHLILCCLLLSTFNLSQHQGLFQWISSHIRWPKYWHFGLSISPSNEYSGLIFFRMDWLGLLAVQETLKSLLQHHSLKASILWLSAFFIVQLSYPYMTTGKTIALTRWTSVGKVMSLLFNMLSRLVIASLPRSKCLPQRTSFRPLLLNKVYLNDFIQNYVFPTHHSLLFPFPCFIFLQSTYYLLKSLTSHLLCKFHVRQEFHLHYSLLCSQHLQ